MGVQSSCTFYIITLSYFYLRSINRTVCTGRNRLNTAASFESMLSAKSGIGKRSPFELDFGGEEIDENNLNSLLRTVGANTPNHSLVTSPITLTPPEPTGANLTNGDTNALANALAQHTVALAGNHQATQDLMRSVGTLTAAMDGKGNRMRSRDTTAARKTHNKKMKRYKLCITDF